MGSAMSLLAATDVHFRYPGASSPAVDGVDFAIEEGEIFGFLGPNGSGKSTTQRLLTRILRGYEGRIEVFGDDLEAHGNAYYNHIGVCFEFPNLYQKLTAEENLEFYRSFFDVPTDASAEALERLDLPRNDKRPVSSWSKGMKMRLTLARSLVNRPRLWFLDEPTTGQDPRHAVMIRKLIRERAEAGTTVFLTTHDMHVADELCDRVGFLVDGALRRVDAPARLKRSFASKVVRVELEDETEGAPLEFDLAQDDEKAAFLDTVRERDVATLHTQEPTLEDVFLRITGRSLAD